MDFCYDLSKIQVYEIYHPIWLVAMGLTLYHGMHIHDMDFRCGVAKKSDSYMSFIILGWNHCGQNWIDS
jgi:hypothetical protein